MLIVWLVVDWLWVFWLCLRMLDRLVCLLCLFYGVYFWLLVLYNLLCWCLAFKFLGCNCCCCLLWLWLGFGLFSLWMNVDHKMVICLVIVLFVTLWFGFDVWLVFSFGCFQFFELMCRVNSVDYTSFLVYMLFLIDYLVNLSLFGFACCLCFIVVVVVGLFAGFVISYLIT